MHIDGNLQVNKSILTSQFSFQVDLSFERAKKFLRNFALATDSHVLRIKVPIPHTDTVKLYIYTFTTYLNIA